MTHVTKTEEEKLRRALAMIGEEAGRDEVVPEPRARTTPWWRHWGTVTGGLVTAAALCAGVLVLALGDDKPTGPSGGNQSGKGQTLEEWIACARVIAEGDVAAVRDSEEPGRVIVTFDVDDWIKPAQGTKRVDLDLVDPTEAGVHPSWKAGTHALIVVPERHDLSADTFEGAQLDRYRDQIERALPKAPEAGCPAYWQDPQGR